MMDSLLEWCQFPVNLHTCTGVQASGDKTYAEPVVKKVYRVDEIKTIVDKYGREYVSQTVLYVPPDIPIKVDDMISYTPDGRKFEIHQIGGFNDGDTGKLDIQVVYL